MALLGQFSLIAALVAALAASTLLIAGGVRRKHPWIRHGYLAVRVLILSTTLATAILWYALASDNFALKYVASNSSRELALMYKFSALWSGQAGSLLFWLWVLAIYLFLVTRSARPGVKFLQPVATGVM